MRSPDCHKVCHIIDGKTVIQHALNTYESVGIHNHIIVVGELAEQVMEAASASGWPVSFTYQQEQRGTGNAARVAAETLHSLQFDGALLVIAGDKVIHPRALKQLIARFEAGNADLAFLVGHITDFPSAGRVLYRDHTPVSIVESNDFAKLELFSELRQATQDTFLSAESALSRVQKYFPSEKKASLALGQVWNHLRHGKAITHDLIKESDCKLVRYNRTYYPEDLRQSSEANLSVYLIRAKALYSALNELKTDNAQREEYLTDIVDILSQSDHKLAPVSIDKPTDVMGFNTRDELEIIRKHLGHSHVPEDQRRARHTVEEWIKALAEKPVTLRSQFQHIYSERYVNIESKIAGLNTLLQTYRVRFGNEPIVISRAPGRVNIMGRHIDHQGGFGNMVAIDRDVFLAVGTRPHDRAIHLVNVDNDRFPDRTFRLDELLDDYNGQPWTSFIETPSVLREIESSPGDWSHYIKAILTRLQIWARHRSFSGLNIVIGGTIPIAAGLSSSSALVVAMGEALCELYDLTLTPQQFVERCGEAEWYVGTRGGAGDHAAMKFGSKEKVCQVGFYPMQVYKRVPFPADHLIVVCHSLHQAKKTEREREQFNQRIACYHLGREWIKTVAGAKATHIHHLRDIDPYHLSISQSERLRWLLQVPLSASRDTIMQTLGERAIPYLNSRPTPEEDFPLRPVVLFGLSECERARFTPDLLVSEQIETFGNWMNISHDGDRLVHHTRDGMMVPYDSDVSDAHLRHLLDRSAAAASGPFLVREAGGYRCSLPDLDLLVDLSSSVSGVRGAQLAGAGLGGCIMVLVRASAYDQLYETLSRHYYESRQAEPEMIPCFPMQGSGVLRI